MAILGPLRFRAEDSAGLSVPGALLKIYNTGTVTPAATYTTSQLNVAHPFPIVADGAGLFPAVFMADGSQVDCRVETASGVLLDAVSSVQLPTYVQNGTFLSTLGSTAASARTAIDAASTASVAALSTGKVARAGDSMTGPLLLNGASAQWKQTIDAFPRYDVRLNTTTMEWRRLDPANGNALTPLVMTVNHSTGAVDFPSTVTFAGSSVATLAKPAAVPDYIVVDQKASGSAGGNGGSANAWVVRDLNTENRNVITGASLASNVVTLPAGTYYAEWSSPAYGTAALSRLWNSTDSSLIGYGTTINVNGVTVNGTSIGSAYFVLPATKNVRVEIACSNVAAASRLGAAASITGAAEIYTTLNIWKVA